MIIKITPVQGFGEQADKVLIRSLPYELDGNSMDIYYAYMLGNKILMEGNLTIDLNDTIINDDAIIDIICQKLGVNKIDEEEE